MCLPHLHRIFSVFSTRFVVGPGIVGSGGCRERRVRGHMMCLPHLHQIFTVFSTRFVVGPGIVGSGGAVKGECEDT